MRARVAGTVLLLLPFLAFAQGIRLPVFFLRYEGGVGSEELEPEEAEDEQLEPSSQRHAVVLRIKEEWSDSLLTNLYTAVSRKEYFHQSGSYTYFYLNPELVWDVTDRLQWSHRPALQVDRLRRPAGPHQPSGQDRAGLQGGRRAEGRPLLRGDLRPVPGRTEGPGDLRRGPGAGVAPRRRLAPCRPLPRHRAGSPSDPRASWPDRFNQEFGVNLSWDPNR